jgi:hypothetical protein
MHAISGVAWRESNPRASVPLDFLTCGRLAQLKFLFLTAYLDVNAGPIYAEIYFLSDLELRPALAANEIGCLGSLDLLYPVGGAVRVELDHAAVFWIIPRLRLS